MCLKRTSENSKLGKTQIFFWVEGSVGGCSRVWGSRLDHGAGCGVQNRSWGQGVGVWNRSWGQGVGVGDMRWVMRGGSHKVGVM